MSEETKSRRGQRGPVRRSLGGAAVAVAVAVGVLAAPAVAAPPPAPAPAAPDPDHGHERTRAAMDAAVRGGVPGVTAQAWDKRGPWSAAAGVGDLRDQTPRGPHDRFRAASITKTFVATVMLQLEAEGNLDLDDKVGTWLPGLVEGNGHDGDRITLRQLLNHTSGIHDYAEDPDFVRMLATPEFFEHRHRTWTPRELVAVAMRHKPYFPPGEGWHYSNTGYLLAGLIIEKATGHPYGDEIRRRVLQPLGLRATSVPGTDPTVPGPSSRAYSKLSGKPDGHTYDVTELNPSAAGASGEMISDAADLNRFYSALLRGRLLPEKQLAEMKRTVPAKGEEAGGGRYGLGLLRIKLRCGTVVWGHGGAIHGSRSTALTTTDGRHALTFNFNGDWASGQGPITEAEFCRK
ncbi:serine hydrolase domain-containing protein [Streptomyces aurantiacus]|uniref:Putative D-alanyl-D-alanine carboxypeptidase n=1 Tax=Streptomyces aurantiacus JA 4570 TaxID=1286094 RepID=S3ZJM7_9ACTN|nr:serine hydrolase domain-containing protein [Streptomyces aurantiacus]EPH43781.1 putative D-alanyl-D-alanine carboxypeptidase [Streptomyces aurantiacus JA 4570]